MFSYIRRGCDEVCRKDRSQSGGSQVGKFTNESMMIWLASAYHSKFVQYNFFRLQREEQSLNNIKQYYVDCKTKEEKNESVSNICMITLGQALIFCPVSATACNLFPRFLNIYICFSFYRLHFQRLCSPRL